MLTLTYHCGGCMKLVFLVTVVAFLLVGCVRSIQPFVKDSQAVYDPALVGKWADGEGNTIEVTGDEAARDYNATLTEKDGKVGNFILHVATVQQKTIVDVAPADL